jgi:hypothetical protein
VVFTGGDHPFTLAVKGDGGDVAGVALEGDDGVRVSAVDIVKSDVLVAGCCEVLFIR